MILPMLTTARASFAEYFRDLWPLWTITDLDLQRLPGLQFRNTGLTQGIHMNENVLGAVPAGDKAITAHSVEPLNSDFQEIPKGLDRLPMGRRRAL